MPTTEERDKYDTDTERKLRERKSLVTAIILIILSVACVAGFIWLWGWLLSTGGLP